METSSYRPLTPSEREMIVWILERGPDGASNFIPQLDVLTARSSCSCGCPSIEFNVPLETARIESPSAFRICGSGLSGEHEVGVMLIAGAGVLSDLEVYVFEAIDHPFGLPAIETLSNDIYFR